MRATDPDEFRRAAQRGRALTERYASERDRSPLTPGQQFAAASELITDLLAHILTLEDSAVPPPYRGGLVERAGVATARAVWNVLAMHPTQPDKPAGEDPDHGTLMAAMAAFAAYLQAC